MRIALRFVAASFKGPWGAQILQKGSLWKKGVLIVSMCCHPFPPQKQGRWLGSCRHWQMSLEEKGQITFGKRLNFYMTFCRQTQAPSESSGPMQLLSSRLTLTTAEGTGACICKSSCRYYQVDHGQRAQRAALVLKQKFLLSPNLSDDDRFDWMH